MSGISGKLACIATATKKASATLTRRGMAREEKTGAEVKNASVRKNGQNKGDNHAAICASDMEITGFYDQATALGIASIVRRMYSTKIVSIHGPAMANTAITAISFGTKARVAS